MVFFLSNLKFSLQNLAIYLIAAKELALPIIMKAPANVSKAFILLIRSA